MNTIWCLKHSGQSTENCSWSYKYFSRNLLYKILLDCSTVEKHEKLQVPIKKLNVITYFEVEQRLFRLRFVLCVLLLWKNTENGKFLLTQSSRWRCKGKRFEKGDFFIMKSSSTLRCLRFISFVKAKLSWKIFLSGGEKKTFEFKTLMKRIMLWFFWKKNLEADNCRWIRQELRRLQT